MKGQIILTVVIILTSFFVLVISIYFLTSSQLTIKYDINAGTQALIAADQALDCYFYLQAQQEKLGDIRSETGQCENNCLFNNSDGCKIGDKKIKVVTTSNTVNGYGIYKDNIFRVLEVREISF